MPEYILPEWIYVPELESSIKGVDNLEDFLNNNSILLSVLNHIHEGISILSPTLDVLFVNSYMQYWYPQCNNQKKHKCYFLYQNSKITCSDCPALICLKTGTPSTNTVFYSKGEDVTGKMSVHATPLFNSNGEIKLILEFVQNITSLEQTKSYVEDLRSEVALLEQQNKLLIGSLTMREKQYQYLEDTILENMEQSVRPALNYLKKKVNEKDFNLVSFIIEQSICSITQKKKSTIFELTSRELQVATLIKDGYSSKQIADKLYITKKSVDFHRSNIRKKMGLDAKENLQIYLEMKLKECK